MVSQFGLTMVNSLGRALNILFCSTLPLKIYAMPFLSRNGNGVAVSDNRKNCIFLYDDQGRLEKTINTHGEAYLPNGSFLFLDKQTLLFANAPSHCAQAPAHIALAVDGTPNESLIWFWPPPATFNIGCAD